MMWPFRKSNEQKLNSDEYEKISKRITEFSAKLEELENKFKILTTNYDNLRGNFNRKLSGIKGEEKVEPKEEETEQNEASKSINNPMFIPYHGSFN